MDSTESAELFDPMAGDHQHTEMTRLDLVTMDSLDHFDPSTGLFDSMRDDDQYSQAPQFDLATIESPANTSPLPVDQLEDALRPTNKDFFTGISDTGESTANPPVVSHPPRCKSCMTMKLKVCRLPFSNK